MIDLFLLSFLDGRRKNPKQKPHTSFNKRLSVAKNWKKHFNCQVKMLKFYLIGDMTKGITFVKFQFMALRQNAQNWIQALQFV